MLIYLWLKSLHLIALMVWIAALFVIQQTNAQRQIHWVAGSALLFTLLSGLWLLGQSWQAFANQSWLWLKLMLVALLFGYHARCFAKRPGRLWQVFAAVTLVIAVILSVVKPNL